MSMLEAKCTRCHQTFVPHDINPEDLIHCYTDEDEECGGIGIIMGIWRAPDETIDTRIQAIALHAYISEMEAHARKYPHCPGVHCRFHHPELTKL